MKNFIILIFSLFLVGCTNLSVVDNTTDTSNILPLPTVDNQQEEFCGSSTEGFCNMDGDCKIFGCSGQICGSRFEKELASTCEWKECYNEQDYSLLCGCVNKKCKWYK